MGSSRWKIEEVIKKKSFGEVNAFSFGSNGNVAREWNF